MYSTNDAVSMFNYVPFTCDVFLWWCCFYVQLCPFHLWCILVMMLFLCSIVSLSLVMYSGDDAVSMFNCVPFTCDVFWWWCCFYVQLCPFHLWSILVMMLFLCSIVSLSLVMYSGVKLFLCSIVSLSLVMYSGDEAVFFYVQLCPFHLWCILVMMLFLCSIVSLSHCDVFLWWCCFYVQLCPFHLWCILVIMLFLCSIVSLSLWCILVVILFLCSIVSLPLVMYSGEDAVSMFNCVPFTCDVFWWWCCFYVQLCPFHLWCILVMMLFLCSIVSLSLVMYSCDDAVSIFNCVPFTCDVFCDYLFLRSIVSLSLMMYSVSCFHVQLCPFHLWCILVRMLFLCSIVSLSLVMYSGDDAVSMSNCVPLICDVFY